MVMRLVSLSSNGRPDSPVGVDFFYKSSSGFGVHFCLKDLDSLNYLHHLSLLIQASTESKFVAWMRKR